jgi:hypothetical protein
MSSDSATLWVLGHKICIIDTDYSYGMVEVTSPPHVPRPPPHYHKSENKFFLITNFTYLRPAKT